MEDDPSVIPPEEEANQRGVIDRLFRFAPAPPRPPSPPLFLFGGDDSDDDSIVLEPPRQRRRLNPQPRAAAAGAARPPRNRNQAGRNAAPARDGNPPAAAAQPERPPRGGALRAARVPLRVFGRAGGRDPPPLNRPPYRPTYPCEEAIETTRRRIERATEKGTLLNYLFSHSNEGPAFTTRGTPLHLACLDTNGERGQAKIELLLEAATQAGLSLQLLASARSEGSGAIQGGHTPLHRLLVNSSATTRSLELVVNAWTGAMFATNHFYGSTPLCDASYGCLLRSLDGFQAKLEIMMNTARQMPQGVEGLITHRGFEGSTALHDAVVSPRWSAPDSIPFRDRIFALVLEACPSAIYIVDNEGRNPLHRCLMRVNIDDALPDANRSLVDLVRALVSNTSKTCLVAALATEKYSESADKTYGQTPIDIVRSTFSTDVEAYLTELARTPDPSNGWTLLHYAAANTIQAAERPPRPTSRIGRVGGRPFRPAMRVVDVRMERADGNLLPDPFRGVRPNERRNDVARANQPVRLNPPNRGGGVLGNAPILGNARDIGLPERARPLNNADAPPPLRRRVNEAERPDQDQRPLGNGQGRPRRVRVRIRVRRVPRRVAGRAARAPQGNAARAEGRDNALPGANDQANANAIGEDAARERARQARDARAQRRAANRERLALPGGEPPRLERVRRGILPPAWMQARDRDRAGRRGEDALNDARIQEVAERVRDRQRRRAEERADERRLHIQERLQQARERMEQARVRMEQADERLARARARRAEGLRAMELLRGPVEAMAAEEEQRGGAAGHFGARHLLQLLENIRGPPLNPGPDEQGQANDDPGQEPPEPEKRRGTKKLIDWLLEVHPEACSTTDSSGRLPIHLAIESGKEWENGVESLARGFPGGVSVVDPATGLFPFVSAATADSNASLDTIFELLRFSPHNLAVANTNA